MNFVLGWGDFDIVVSKIYEALRLHGLVHVVLGLVRVVNGIFGGFFGLEVVASIGHLVFRTLVRRVDAQASSDGDFSYERAHL